MASSASITHLIHTDLPATLTRIRLALVEGGTIPAAARALGCSAPWLRATVRAHPDVRKGVALRGRGYPPGTPREGRRGRSKKP